VSTTNAQILAQLRVLTSAVDELNRKADILMTEQTDVDAATAEIESDVAGLNATTTAIKTAIADLEAQIAAGQAPDLTALKAAVADLDTATASAAANVPNPLP
jgi:chromosome segregation ATPase